METLQWILRKFPVLELNAQFLADAARGGNVEMVQWINEQIQSKCTQAHLRHATDAACDHGRLKVVQNSEEAFGIVPHNINKAVVDDHFDVVEYLVTKYKDRVTYSKPSPQKAAKCKDPRVVRLLDPARKLSYSKEVFGLAVNHSRETDPQGEMLQFLFSKSVPRALCRQVLRMAVGYSSMQSVQVTCDAMVRMSWWNRQPLTISDVLDVMDSAADEEDFDILEYLFQKLPMDSSDLQDVVVVALENPFCSVKLRKLLMQKQPTAFSNFSIDDAASLGRLDVLRFMHEELKITEVSSDAIDSAASGGYLHVIKYTAKHLPKADCTTEAMDGASCNGHFHVVKNLHKKFPNVGCTHFAMVAAVTNGHLRIVRFLHENCHEGCGPEAMDNACLNGTLHLVQFLHENRAEGCTTEAIVKSAQNGHSHVVEFLLAPRPEATARKAFEGACSGGQLQVVKWLLQHNHGTRADYERALKLAKEATNEDTEEQKQAKKEIVMYLEQQLRALLPSQRYRCDN